MSNRIDGSLVLGGGSANADAPYGTGRIQWVVSNADVTAPAGPTAGATTVEILTGFDAPVGGTTLLSRPSALGVNAARGFYLRLNGAGGNTMLYWTIDGGTNWAAALLA
jgi:hypothetical protein